ncbi:MAG TPA: hypothetical protein VLL05_21280 [Terriglobales bacterium]|nr:hypothetical protein [Terriglobales bacterium]
MKNYPLLRNGLILAVLAALGLLIAGYHPGAEDDGVYLSAVKRDLNPSLYPHDSDFFAVQLQATIFDKVVATSVRLTHLPVGWVIFAWHYVAIYLVLLGSWRLSRRCFPEEYAQWASTALVAALLTLPVAGIALYIVDQNLHPRALATAAILAAIVATLDRKFTQSIVMLVLAALFHPIMASFGISFCIFLAWREPRLSTKPTSATLPMIFALTPLGWIFEPTSAAWRVAANTRDYYFLGRWEWYDWLGVVAPLGILWWYRKIGERDHASSLAYLSTRLTYFGAFQMIVAILLMWPQRLERIRPLQPMRYLHLLFLVFIIVSGGLLGQKVLRTHWVRWAIVFVPLAAGMFFAQRETYSASAHLEWPGSVPANPWLQAFAWIRANTPADAYFAAGPEYMRRPGNDYHSFRALAERSVLADLAKDSAVATQVPRLSTRWLNEVESQQGWEHFTIDDFQRLKTRFGINWVLLQRPLGEGMDCPYQNSALRVCHVP